MSRFAAALSTCIIAMVLAIGTALVPLPAAAARVSNADEIALKQAIVACKAEAKGKKMGWLTGRKYVTNCVAEALKGSPQHKRQSIAQGPSGYERGEMGRDLAKACRPLGPIQ
jgi:hypothetical protein